MKKLSALLLALAMVVCLAACTTQPKPAEQSSVVPQTSAALQSSAAQTEASAASQPADTTQAETSALSEISNPMADIESLEKLSETANCALLRPEGAEISEEAFFMIDGNPQIAEYDFKANGKPCTLRFANVGIETDICGIYSEGNTLFADSDSETHYIQNDDVTAQRWLTVDGQYVFIVNTADGWEWTDFDAICSQFMDMEPKTWSADVPYADYKALEGYYMVSEVATASISVRFDHALLIVYAYTENGDTMAWEMNAELKDGKLVYEKESISRQVINESDGTSKLVPEADGGAGYAEILPDGSLSFAGAYSEALHEFVLPRMS